MQGAYSRVQFTGEHKVAVINGRTYCIPDDVKTMRYSILRHRIMLNFAAMADDIKEETIIDAIIGTVKTP